MSEHEIRGRIDPAGTAAILGAMLCWTTGPLFIRYLTGHLDAWSQNLWRYTTAMLVWLPYLIFKTRQGKVPPAVWKRAIIPSLANILMQSLWAWSFYYIKPGFGTLLARSSVIWTTTFCLIYFPDERGLVKSRRFWSGMVLSAIGLTTIVTTRKVVAGGAEITGIVIMLIAAATWSLYTICVRIAFRKIDSRTGFSVVSVYTVCGLSIIAMLFGKPGQITEIGSWPVACIVISGILSISLAHTLYYISIQRIGAAIPALAIVVSPFATLLLSMMVFAERLTPWQWAGGVVLISGSVLSIWAQTHLRKV